MGRVDKRSESTLQSGAYLAGGHFNAFDAYLTGTICNIGMIVARSCRIHLFLQVFAT